MNPDWRVLAACKGSWDLFFSRDPAPDADLRVFAAAEKARAGEAVRICRYCPVTAECGEAAGAQRERWGIWAGEDRERGIPVTLGDPPALCGKGLHLMTEENSKQVKGTLRVRCRACLRESDRRTSLARHARRRQRRREQQLERAS